MIRINLLPYRDERRQAQILRYLAVGFAAVGTAVLLSLAAYSYSSMQLSSSREQLQDIQARNKALKAKIGELSKFKEVQVEVQKKLDLVDKLQTGRFRSLGTILGLSFAIPDNVWLTRLGEASGSIQLSGLGQSNRAVAAFMRALEEREEFSGVNLQVIKREIVDGVPLRSFSLSMKRVDVSAKTTKDKKVPSMPGSKAS